MNQKERYGLREVIKLSIGEVGTKKDVFENMLLLHEIWDNLIKDVQDESRSINGYSYQLRIELEVDELLEQAILTLIQAGKKLASGRENV